MIERYQKMFDEGRGDDALDDALNRIIEQSDTTDGERHVARMMLEARPD